MGTRGKRTIALVQAAALTAAAVLSGMPAAVQAAPLQEENEQRLSSAQTGEASAQRKISFNEGWRFFQEDGAAIKGEGKDFDDSLWRVLDLPHDYSIESDFDPNSPSGANGGYLNGGVGWYRKTFTLPESMKGKRISIDFGGVYMDSTTYVNGVLIGNYPYGYSPFSYDITDQLVADGVTENVIAVKVNHQQPSSRWYSGSGIYRNVDLVVTEDIHVERYGTFVTTPDLEECYGRDEAQVSVKTKVGNDGDLPEQAEVITTIYDSQGNVFAEPVTTEAKKIGAGEVMTYEQMITTAKPKLWDTEDPNLYEVVSEVLVDGEVVDTYETTFGFRWVEMDPNEGFFLNNEYMKLNGVCMHHDQGALGAVANYRAIERQMEIMKSMGVNAIRVTHNPAADELLEICNKMGLMVIDEAFDCWESGKRAKDYGRFFAKAATHPDAEEGMTWAEFDIKNMVERGKNDPCVIMWSIGNEIVNASVGTAANLVKWVGEADPTRPATQGFNNFIDGFWDGGMKKVADVTGVVGFNYGEKSYDAAHSEYPDWIIMGTETSSAVRSRGFYSVDDQKKIRSCYDDGNTVGWGRSAESAWKANRDRKFVMGEFMWTGFDYIGEPSPYHNQYPAKSSYFGTVDTAGIPKDAYYIYQSQWTTAEENPMVHLLPHWNWENDDSIKKDGKIAVHAYSNAASVELFLNGESLGKKDFYQRKTSDGRSYQEGENEHIYLEWQVAYEPGELKAVARDFDGNIIAEDMVKTAKDPAQVRLTPDREVITADGLDLSYILVEILDSEGNLVPTADNNVKFQISGNGKIVGVDNGDATEVTQSYKGSERKAYSGKAMVIVQSTTDMGSFALTASSGGLRSDKAKVFTADSLEEEQLLGYEDPETIYVKKGEDPKLPETVAAVYSSQKREEKRVAWEKIDPEALQRPGMIRVKGVVEDTQDRVMVNIIVVDYIGIKPVHVVTYAGTIPQMPDTVSAVYNTGEEEKIPVAWEEITEDQVADIGSFAVEGTAEGFDEKISATVRVAESVHGDGKDIARKNGTYPIPTASWVQPNGNDPVSAINNGTVVYSGGAAGERWIPWGHGVTDEWVQLEFEKPIETGKVGLDFWSNDADTAMGLPDSLIISYSMDGENWTEAENQNISEKKDLKKNEENIFTFDTVTAKYIRWNFHNEAKLAAGVSEVHVYEKEVQLDSGTSADLQSLQINGTDLEGFSPDQHYYTVELEYGESIPQITAQTEDPNAVLFVIPAISKDQAATVQVVSEDGKTQKNYSIQFHEKLPVLERASIQLENESLMEDDVEPILLTAVLQDGTELAEGVLEVVYTVGNPEVAEVKDGKLYAFNAGTTTLKAVVTHQNKTVESNELNITIQVNPDKKIITGYEQVTVVTAKGQIPVLPAKVRATFDKGLPKMVDVTWDKIDPEQCEAFGEFIVEGRVSGQELRPKARVIVKGIAGVQQFSCATPLGVIPKLSEKAKVYYSDGTADELPIAWEEHPQSMFKEDGSIVTIKGSVTDQKLDGSIWETAVTVRVTSDIIAGDKFTGYKNGFYWPLGIASFTNGQGVSGDSASELNDNIVSREASGNNRWCNWTQNARAEDWAGIIFGLEEVTYKFIDNLDIDFYIDHGSTLPKEYVIEYYDGEYFNEPPTDPDNVTSDHPAGVEENWKPVSNMQAPEELSETQTNHITFDTVETCAIRIRMKAQEDKCLAITEMCAYEKLAVSGTNPVLTGIFLNKKPLENFVQGQTEYVYKAAGTRLPEITAETGENSSVSIVYPKAFGEKAQVIVRAEDGVGTKTYWIQIDQIQDESLEEAIKRAEEAQKKAEEAQKEAEKYKEEAEASRKEAELQKQEAERYKQEAEAAKAEAEIYKKQAEEARQKAEEAEETAREAAEAAQTAKRAAEEARKAAEEAKEQAGADSEAAKAAKAEAEKKAEEARKAQEEAAKSKEQAETAKTEAEAAKQAAEEASEKAETAKAEAEEAQRGANAALIQAQAVLEEAKAAQAAAEAWAAEAAARVSRAEELLKQAEAEADEAEEARKKAEADRIAAEEALKAALEAQKKAEEARAAAERAKEEAEKAKADAQKAKNDAAKERKTKVKKVSLSSVKSTRKKQLTVTWKKLKGIDGYELSYAANNKFKKAAKKHIGKLKTRTVINKAKSKKTYFVRIRAYKKVNGQKVYGSYSKVKKEKVK